MNAIFKTMIVFLLDNRLTRSMYKKHTAIKAKLYERRGKFKSIYYKSVFAVCGSNLTIYGSPCIYKPECIFVGDNFTINNNAQISPRGNVYIGNNVTMSRGSQITAGTLDTSNWVDKNDSGNWLKRDHVSRDVHIADGTWLCVNSVILPGVSIKGKGVIVAAGAVVTRDITEDFVIVGGVPAKIIKRLKR